MRTYRFVLPSAALVSIVACGGAQDTILLDGGNGGSDAASDAAIDAAQCDITQCATIPDGFVPVGLMAQGPCPQGWSSTDVVTAPAVTDGACSCSCSVTAQPDCTTGSVARSFDDTSSASCTQPATTFQANGGTCTSVGGALYLNHAHYAVEPAAPVGGTCTYTSQVDSSKVTSTPERLCAPPTTCLGALCGQNVCVSKAGDVACPSAFSHKTLVGGSATATCTACTAPCAVTAKCTGTLGFFTDSACSSTPVSFTADGTCNTNPTSNIGPYDYYSYTGSVASAACSGTPPTSPGTPSLNSPTTVCCQHN